MSRELTLKLAESVIVVGAFLLVQLVMSRVPTETGTAAITASAKSPGSNSSCGSAGARLC
jgi:hypothetical protein